MIDTKSDDAQLDGVAADSTGAQIEDEPREKDNEHAPRKGEGEARGKDAPRRQFSITLRSLAAASVVAVLISAVGVLGWLYFGARQNLAEQARQSENRAHAEQVALDYAVGAAAMSYEDLSSWKAKLVAGTSPELKERLSKAATSMEQILVPLEWSSTARALAGKVRSVQGDVYVVDSFVSVMTKTMQAPEPLQSTATYSVTIDGGHDWQITDVGGVGNALEQK